MTGKRLRILMTSYDMPSESKIGVGHQVHALANALVDLGHDVTVATPCTASAGARYTTMTLNVPRPMRTFRWAFALRRLDMTQFDALHAHGDDYWLWRRRVPVHIRTMHGSCLAEALHITGVKERVRMVVLGLSELLATLVADRTVAVSANTTRWMPWVRTVIPNGVALDRFGKGDLARERQPTVLFVGTYENRKRGRFLMEVFAAEVLVAIPSARMWMVCTDAPTAPGVEVLGRLTDEELAARYSRAWVFCLPSTYEGFGIPYIEALAAGLPVVASPNPGALELSRRSKALQTVTDDRIGAAIVSLLSDEQARRRLGEQARVDALEYDLGSVAQRYVDLYRAGTAS